jgi:cysteine-rich repeat protein
MPGDVLASTDAATSDAVAAAERSSVKPQCGNRIIEDGEQCDDGNTLDCDGCTSFCILESISFPCRDDPMTFNRYKCGNGIVTSDESCDDGNETSGDGCSAECKEIEPGYRCRVPGKACRPICGDKILKDTESCDDGNTEDGDGCSSYCLAEPGWDCTNGTCSRLATVDGGQLDGGQAHLACGDGIVSGAEECDVVPSSYDYEFVNEYGGCTTKCLWGPFCGDGQLDDPEQCDHGRSNGVLDSEHRGCTIGCTWSHYCGDGMVDTNLGEQCDLGERSLDP